MPIDGDEFNFGEEISLKEIAEEREEAERSHGVYYGDDTFAPVYIKKSVLRRLKRHKGMQSWSSFMSLVADVLDVHMKALSIMVLAHDDLREKLFGEKDETDLSKVEFEKELLEKGVNRDV